jgi:hypothetical protein
VTNLSGLTAEELVPGNPAALADLGRQLASLSSGLGDAGSILGRIDGGEWQGVAADAFRHAVQQQPARYASAAAAFALAGGAIEAYAEELLNAQRQAASAISEWDSAQALTTAWRRQTEQAGNATHRGPDPGADGRVTASATVNRARAELDAAAARLRAALAQARDAAPSQPNLLHRFVQDAENVAKHVFQFGKDIFEFAAKVAAEDAHLNWQFIEGVGAGVSGLVAGVWALGKGGMALLLDPHTRADFTKEVLATAEGVSHHPAQFGENFLKIVFNPDEWKHDPEKALGELAPTIALAGAGAAADALGRGAAIEVAAADAALDTGNVAGAAPWADSAAASIKAAETAKETLQTVQAADAVHDDAVAVQAAAQGRDSAGAVDGMTLDAAAAKTIEVGAGALIGTPVVIIVP